MDKILKIFKQMFFPQKCKCCFKIAGEHNLCEKCKNELIACLVPKEKQQIDLKIEFMSSIYVHFYYKDRAKKVLTKAKFENPTHFLNSFEYEVGEDVKKIISENSIDLILPVPAHKSKYYAQEFDLPMEMAKILSKYTSTPVLGGVVKSKKTAKQHELKKEERKLNLLDAFSVKSDIKNKNILIIDDVITTGSTLSALSTELKLSGCGKIYGWVYTFNTYK